MKTELVQSLVSGHAVPDRFADVGKTIFLTHLIFD